MIVQIDVTQLAADLTDYLYDRGAWDVGSGGQETVTDIAEFIGEWLIGGCQSRKLIEVATLNNLGTTLATLIGDENARPFCMPEFRRQNSEL